MTTLDDGGREQPYSHSGAIAIRGLGVTPGYLRNPDADRESFINDWSRTGDPGVVDRNGAVRIEGRIKELISRAADEDADHPAVADAACFGLPDKTYGEIVAATVVLRQATQPRDLVFFCSERLAPFKVPNVVRSVEGRRKAGGKVRCPDLAAQFANVAR